MATLRQTAPLRYRKILKKGFFKIFWTLLWGAMCSLVLVLILNLVEKGEIAGISKFLEDNHRLIMISWFVCNFVIAGWIPFYELLYLLTYFYDSDDKYVYIRKGVIIKREITLPFTKITDVYVDQDTLDFLLCIYDVHISTPTAESGAFAHIDGVDKHGAAVLKAMLLEKINVDQITR